MTASNVPRRGQSVNQILATSVSVFRATLLKCLPLAMIGVLFASVPNFYLRGTGWVPEQGLPVTTQPVYWWLLGLASVATLYMCSAMMLRQIYASGGFTVTGRQELAVAVRRLPSLLMTWLLMQLSLWFVVMIGIALSRWAQVLGLIMVVPGAFLFTCYLMLLPVILVEGQVNPVVAVRRCIALVLTNFWRIFASFVIALLATAICFIVFSAIMGILHTLFAGLGHAFEAISAAAMIAVFAMVFVFYSALTLVIHSSASSSA
jgi:hypothetical protein